MNQKYSLNETCWGGGVSPTKKELEALPRAGLTGGHTLPACDMSICGVEGRLSPAGALLEMLLDIDNDDGESTLSTKKTFAISLVFVFMSKI